MPEVSERSFEKTIECGLLRYGPYACAGEKGGVREASAPFGEFPPGIYRKRPPEEYDQSLCLIPRDVIDSIIATQPKETETSAQGDLYVRCGPGSVRLGLESTAEYIKTRFPR
jgi:hypothetical protein